MVDDVLNTDTYQFRPEDALAREITLVPALTIAFHPDVRRIGERVALPGLGDVPAARAAVRIARGEPSFGRPYARAGRPLASPFVSRRPIVLYREGDSIIIDPTGSGTDLALNGHPLSEAVRCDPKAVEGGVVLELSSQIVLVLHRVRSELPLPLPPHGMIGASDAMQSLREQISVSASNDLPVLVRGETGSGKELVARAIHDAGSRVQGPYRVVNMAAIPESLAASELFGHVRGAFSDAKTDRDGFFAQANGGTLFMDEIGDTPAAVQPMLLRALETGEVQQVGARRARRVDVRLVSATDADLEAAVAENRFRSPLLYRLANHEIRVPPLRERRDDIGRLLHHFLRLELERLGRPELLAAPADRRSGAHPWLPANLVTRLVLYGWPGNVRQLRSVASYIAASAAARGAISLSDPQLERLLSRPGPQASASAPVASPAHPAAPATATPPAAVGGVITRIPQRRLSDVSDDELSEVLESVDWRLGAAAAQLGVSRPALNDRVDKHPTLRRAKAIGEAELRALWAEHHDLDAMWRSLRVSRRSLKLRLKELGI